MTHLFQTKLFKAAVLGLTSTVLIRKDLEKTRKANCCGIIGNISNTHEAEKVVAEGIIILQNRGYDSAGISSIFDKKIKSSKYATNFAEGIDCIEKVSNMARIDHKNSSVAIGHTRWATCGEKTDNNAHPHWDNKKRIALVHNGTIYNYLELKSDLSNEGYTFESETDSEVIAVLIGKFLDQGSNWMDAVKECLKRLDGSWGLVIMNADEPNSLICCRRGSPLLVGFKGSEFFVSSEAVAFQNYTNEFIRLQDFEIIKLTKGDDISGNYNERIVVHKQTEVRTTPKPGFDCFFIEEIMDQPETIRRTLNFFHRLMPEIGTTKLGGFDANKDIALSFDKVLFIGCGSSYNAALAGAHYLQVFESFDVITTIEASNFYKWDLPKGRVGVICLTQSGESADIIRAMKLTKENGAVNIGLTNVVGSLITTLCEFGVYLNCGRETAVPATKSFTAQVIGTYLITLWYSYYKNPNHLKVERNLAVKALKDFPELVSRTLIMNQQKAKELALKLLPLSSIFILGKGNTYPISREIALKLKECCYIHAEAMPLGELKHGPLALIDPLFDGVKSLQSHVIILAIDNYLIEEVKVAIGELKSRKAYVIVVTDCLHLLDQAKIDFYMEIPVCKPLASLLTLYPMQLLCYELAKIRGINPDKPRNLAKTVTVL